MPTSSRLVLTIMLSIVAILLIGIISQPEVYRNNQQFKVFPKSQIIFTGEGKLLVSSADKFTFTKSGEAETVGSQHIPILPPDWERENYYWTDGVNSSGEWSISGTDKWIQTIFVRPLGDVTVIVHDWLMEAFLQFIVVVATMCAILILWT